MVRSDVFLRNDSQSVDPARPRLTTAPAFELGVLALTIAVGVASYFLISRADSPQRLISPPLVALLLIANLVPGIVLMMLFGRRVAMRRAVRSPVGGGGRLHVRLVALFSMVAAIPMLLVTIFASLLFQYGVQFWYSDQARSMIENASNLAGTSFSQQLTRWDEATTTMAADMSAFLQERSIESPEFSTFFGQQVYFRSMSEAALFAVTPKNGTQTLSLVNPYSEDLTRKLTPKTINRLRGGEHSVVIISGNRVQVMTMLPGSSELFLYAARVGETGSLTAQVKRAEALAGSYRSLLVRARRIQLGFNAALLVISLFIVGIAVWVALAVADRVVRPVGELVDAARRVTGGDLSARVPDPRSRDEVGTLAEAFNQMTGKLQEQNNALLNANGQLNNRRALIEAVMGGVSAGVISTSADGIVSIANNSADRLLGMGSSGLVGRELRAIAPELQELIERGDREAVVQIGAESEPRTLAVRVARTDMGPILTFDDITERLLDQRRAAWSDVARRIAHEIKNPLTPIQLAAERLNRRYADKLDPEDTTFVRLIDTIIRQVGDLRRMVDEFSSFARMPKPSFHSEHVVAIARQTLFLHEVAHPSIAFSLTAAEPGPILVCDRRQIAQALTNIVKNAVEAIVAKCDGGGRIDVQIVETDESSITIIIEDNGIGLPPERDRIVEPYVTTRARGTGLGLAIVSKIVEEHFGTMTFADRAGGGTIVTIALDTTALIAGSDIKSSGALDDASAFQLSRT